MVQDMETLLLQTTNISFS